MLSAQNKDESVSHSFVMSGWSGLGVICAMGISLMADEPPVWMSSIEMSASSGMFNFCLRGLW